jgi:chitin disaccharide deacetylase
MIILCADDYGLTDGVSRAIDELASHRRLSATSAIVTADEWPRYVGRLAALRSDVATGLHLNLTLGEPLGRMPGLAPAGTLPEVGKLVRTALTGRLDKREIKAELIRQMERFEATLGSPPDHIDGHQHVHSLPIVRDALLEAIAAMNWMLPPLVRNPADSIANIVRRRRSAPKAMTVAALSAGFGRRLSRAGLPSNDTFGGFSDFEAGTDYRVELTAAFKRAGTRHLVMCHPGFVDDQLRALDPIVERRAEEYRSLMDATGLPPRIWHPERPANGPVIDWNAM